MVTASIDRFQQRILGYDLWLLVAPAMASAIGIVMVYTAGQNSMHYASRQLLFSVLGLVAMAIFASVDYHRLEQAATPAYVALLAGLVLIMIPGVGSSQLGATRWFAVGPLLIQPSEFAVLGIILAISTYCARRPDGLTWRDLSRVLLMTGIPMGLIFIQPDFGTAAIVFVTLFVMLVGAGVPLRVLLGLALATVLAVVAAFQFHLAKSYQVARITAFLHPNSADNYNTLHSMTAIGAGGLFGAGIGHGAETTLGFVPSQLTDFIFSAIGEQLGFIGSVAMLVLLGSIAWRVLVIGLGARDVFGRVLCSGIFAFMAFSTFENVGMGLGIMPVAGIPLPFISYGGSAMICFYAACGIALSISRRRGR